jgi:hypothetical protein
VSGVKKRCPRAMALDKNGVLVAGSHFVMADGMPAKLIAPWDGGALRALVGGLSN